MKIKKFVILIIFLFILNTLNGCIQDEFDENSDMSTNKFIIDNLQIFPNITIPRQPIVISIDVENLNNTKIVDFVNLSWDDGEYLSKSFQLNPFETKTITWEISEYETGVYNINIDELKGSYIISDKIAWFELSDFKIESGEIEINETANVSVIVENIGYISDYYVLDLYVNDLIEQTKKVIFGIGEKKNISFQFKKSDLDIYNIGINDFEGEIHVVKFKDIDFKYPLLNEPSWRVMVSTDFNMFDIIWKCNEEIKVEIYEISDNIELFHSSLHGKNDGSARVIVGEKHETLETGFYGLIIKDIYDKILYQTQKRFRKGIANISVVDVSTIYTDISIDCVGSESSFPLWICFLKLYIDGDLIEEKSDINWVFHNSVDTIYNKRIYHFSKSIEEGVHDVKIILKDCYSNTVVTLIDKINY